MIKKSFGERDLMACLAPSFKFDKAFFKELLNDSCYYPASGADISPIKYLSEIDSFIYCDYRFQFGKLSGSIERNFESSILLKTMAFDIKKIGLKKARFASNYGIGDWSEHMLEVLESQIIPRAVWTIWEINSKLVSILYVGWEGVDFYRNIYLKNNRKPLVLCIIQPGHTMGGNWTDFFDKKGPFLSTVYEKQGPDYMLLGCYDDHNHRWQIRIDHKNYIRVDDSEARISVMLGNDNNRYYLFLVQLDKRTNEEKENDIKRKILIKEQEKKLRKDAYCNWWEIYQSLRLKNKRALKPPINLNHEENIIKQQFDRSIKQRNYQYKLINAIRRQDFKAVEALRSKLDSYIKNMNDK